MTILFIIGLLVLIFFCAVDLWHLKEMLKGIRTMVVVLEEVLLAIRNK